MQTLLLPSYWYLIVLAIALIPVAMVIGYLYYYLYSLINSIKKFNSNTFESASKINAITEEVLSNYKTELNTILSMISMKTTEIVKQIELHNSSINHSFMVTNEQIKASIKESIRNTELELSRKVQTISSDYKHLLIEFKALQENTKNWFSEFEVRKNAFIREQQRLTILKAEVDYDLSNLERLQAETKMQVEILRNALENEIKRNSFLNEKLNKYKINIYSDSHLVSVQCRVWRDKIEKNDHSSLFKDLEEFLTRNHHDDLMHGRTMLASEYNRIESEKTNVERYNQLMQKLNTNILDLIKSIEKTFG